MVPHQGNGRVGRNTLLLCYTTSCDKLSRLSDKTASSFPQKDRIRSIMSDEHTVTHTPVATWVFLPALILLLAFGLRLHRLAYDSIWWDEGYAVWMARMPLSEMFFQTAHDNAPPLSYILLHGWRALVGDEEFALRVMSVFCGLLTVALSYQIGREIGRWQAGAAGALLVATARFPVWWSQELRLYAVSTLFATLAIWAAVRLFMGRRGTWQWAAVFAGSLGLGLLLVYLSGAVVIALNLAFVYVFFVSPRRWRLAAAWIGAQIVALAIFLPWVFYAYRTAPTWTTPQPPVSLWFVCKLYLSTTFLGIATDVERYVLLLIAGVAILAVAGALTWIGSRREQRTGWVTLVVCILVSPVLIYLLSLPRGRFNYPTPAPRYFLLLSSPLYILLGWGMAELNKHLRFVGTGILAALVAVSGWSLSQYYPGLHLGDDYVSLAATLQALRHPGDGVVLNNDKDWPIFAYHYPKTSDLYITNTLVDADESQVDQVLRSYAEGFDGIWLVETQYARVTDPNHYLQAWLEARSTNTRRYVFPEAQLWFFAMTEERGDPDTVDRAVQWPDAMVSVDAPIADGVRLTGYTQPVLEVRAGNRLIVGLGWHIEEGIAGEWPVAVKLIRPDGNEITSTLLSLGGSGKEDRFLPVELFIPPDTPGGRAQIVFAAGKTWQPLGTIHIRARRNDPFRAVELPDTVTPINVRFGEAIILAGMELPERDTWSPGELIPLILYWQADGVIAERYKVFVHLVGESINPATGNTIWGQFDQEPRGGEAATTGWRLGEVIEDGYLIPIWEGAPPGRYTLQVGLYQLLDGQRLTAFDEQGAIAGDALIVFKLEITR